MGYRTQAPDTDPRIEAMQIEAWRRMSAAEKAQRASDLTTASRELARTALRAQFPDASEREIFLRLAARTLTREEMIAAYDCDPEDWS